MQNITTVDFIILPFYLMVIYLVAYHIKNKYYPKEHICRPYFIPALSVKIFGSIAIGLIYEYYYQGGDTFNFFYHSKIINNSINFSVGTWLRLITHQIDETNLDDLYAISEMYWYDDISSYTVSAVGAFIGVFCFNKYLVINIILASISFLALWSMFVVFVKQYPSIPRILAIAILFMPSVIIWGSGLFKDTICIAAIAYLYTGFYYIFTERKVKVILIILVLLALILLFLIKTYLLVSFFPLLILKTILDFKKQLIINGGKRWTGALLIGFTILIGFLGFEILSKELVKFSLENVVTTVVIQKNYLLSVSLEQDGSAYNLGDFEPNIAGMAKKVIPAVNVTLFRPYLWESKSIFILFTSLEAQITFLLTLFLFFKRNLIITIKQIYKDPNLLFCLIFTLIFAFFVGISSFNFGTLARYKIPCIPFFMLFLSILLFEKKQVSKP
jgi:hypothetical protein